MEADEGEIDEMIRTFDIDGNGEIDFNEFLEGKKPFSPFLNGKLWHLVLFSPILSRL